VISKSVEVTSFVNPAQFTGETLFEAAFPVVDGVLTFPVVEDGATLPVVAGVEGLAPLVKETRPVETGADGFCEVVSGLG